MKHLNIKLSLYVVLFLGILSCEQIAFEPQPGSDNAAVFDEFWNTFNEKYAMFEAKNVDWQQLYNENRSKIDNNSTQQELFTVMGEMLLMLRDGHSALFDNENGNAAIFDIEEGFPTNLDEEVIANNYLQGNQRELGGFIYTTLPGNIGYVIFRDFLVEITDDEVNQILTELQDTDGLILDVRGNGGGDPFGAGLLASHFTTTAIDAGFERFKTGPGANDFSDSPFLLKPTSGVSYTKPVAVLTNRLCYSATTTLLYLMDPMPHVTFIGGRTGGGSGSVADGQLINGWYYALSVSEFIDAKGRNLDDGVDPDILVNLDESDATRDEIIERALQELN